VLKSLIGSDSADEHATNGSILSLSLCIWSSLEQEFLLVERRVAAYFADETFLSIIGAAKRPTKRVAETPPKPEPLANQLQ
jgi:hypothetical protein